MIIRILLLTCLLGVSSTGIALANSAWVLWTLLEGGRIPGNSKWRVTDGFNTRDECVAGRTQRIKKSRLSIAEVLEEHHYDLAEHLIDMKDLEVGDGFRLTLSLEEGFTKGKGGGLIMSEKRTPSKATLRFLCLPDTIDPRNK